MYGATEATARLSILDPAQVDARPGSIGRGIPGVTLRVLDEQGRPVASGETGEIVAEGENIARGYFQDAAETAVTFRDGRLHTGDLATVDRDGYVTVLGRAKSFLKCGGTRTSAERFEEALLAFPDIVEAAVMAPPAVPARPGKRRTPRSWWRATQATRPLLRGCASSPSRSCRCRFGRRSSKWCRSCRRAPPARCSGSSCTTGCARGKMPPEPQSSARTAAAQRDSRRDPAPCQPQSSARTAAALRDSRRDPAPC